MESKLCLSEEHASDGRSSPDSDILQIEFKPLDLKRDFPVVLGILWEAWLMVCGQDLKDEIEIKFQGEMQKMPGVEAQLYYYLQKDCQILLAFHGSEICGIMVYGWVFDKVGTIRMLYFPAAYRGMSLGIKMVRSIPDLKKILFQTHKKIEPKALFGAVGDRAHKIYESDEMLTWEMTIDEGR